MITGCLGTNTVQQSSNGKILISYVSIFLDISIISNLSNNGIVISNVLSNIVDLKYIYEIAFKVRNTEDLDNVIKNLLKLDYVSDIERVMK